MKLKRYGQTTGEKMGNDNDVLLLKDPAFLMILLAALCKKHGGSLTFSEEDVASVTSADAMGLYQNPDDKDGFIIKIVSPEDYRQYMADAKEKKAEKTSTIPRKYTVYNDTDDNDDWEN
jgi:hypothetical protein